jgi:hypothetical protein
MSAHRGGDVHVLCSHICDLDFRIEPPFDRADNDSGDVPFVKATKFIRGQDAMEEFLAWGMYPLSTNVSLDRVADGVTLVSRLKLPLPKSEGVVGSYTHLEHDACAAGLHKGGCLKHVFELAGVAYRSHSVPGTDAFTKASKKRKMNAAGKTPAKHAKAPRNKMGESAKVVVPQGKVSLK